MFDNLTIKNGMSKLNNKIDEVFFLLNKDDNGFFIKVLDGEYSEVDPAKTNHFDKETNEILKLLSDIEEASLFNIAWGAEKEKTYLHDHNLLAELVKKSEFLININREKINYENGVKNLHVEIELLDDENLQSKFLLDYKFDNFEFLNDNLVLHENKIYDVLSIGENFLETKDLNSSFKKDELERFLTIMFTYFDNVNISYKDYQLERYEMADFNKMLVIEKIDKDRSLYLRVGGYISTLNYEFLKEYMIKTAVVVNDLEEKIQLTDVNVDQMNEVISEIIKIIVKHQRLLKIRDSYYFDGNLIIMEEQLAKEFITKELSNLLSEYKIIGTDKFKKYNIKKVKPKLITSLSHSINFLEGDVDLEIEGEKMSIFDVISMYKENSYITLSDGSNALINKKYIEKLERLFKLDKKEEKAKVSIFDLPLLEELIEDKMVTHQMTRYKEVYLGFNNLLNMQLDTPPIKATLREYQNYGYRWLRYLYMNELGGCLADDMGLGKTIQTIALLSSIYPQENKSTLIVMPKSLIYNWANEIKKFNPNLTVGVYYGTNRDIDEAMKSQIILTTYGTVRNDVMSISKIKFQLVVLDESQNIKNINSQITKAVMLLDSDHRLALSGTPVENNLGELYSLFRFLNPNMFGSADEFNRFYVNPIQRDNDSDIVKELRKKIYPFILRRTKKEVLKDLPEKVEKTMYIEMNDKQKKLYEERRNFYYELVNTHVKEHGIAKSQFFILQALNELRQIASNPESKSDNSISSSKRSVLMHNILDAVANNHKILVFTNFIKTIENITEDLEEKGIKYLSMTGATKNRQELVDRFQRDKSCKVFVMTLKTGGVGLNLTAADTIFIYDPWWNKTAEDQAVDRSHRMGQKNTVFSYKMISTGTIEEKMLLLQQEKSRLFDELISDDSASIKSLTKDDIEYILGE